MVDAAGVAGTDFSDLRAVFVNCTLNPSPAQSHTQGLLDVSTAIMRAQGVSVDEIRAVDHDLPRACTRT